jgi:hypothetical protein
MSFFVHFKTEFDALLQVNTLNPILLKASEASCFHLEVEEDYLLFCNISPFNNTFEHKKLLPYTTKLTLKNGIVASSNECVQITEFPLNHFEVLFLKNCVAMHSTPTVLKQQSYFIKGKEHTATIFFDGIYQISIQEKDLLFAKEIEHQIDHISIEKIKNKEVIILEAKTNTLEDYYLILLYKNNAYEIVTEGLFEKIEYSADSLTTLQKQNDMAGHAKVVEYELKNDAVIVKDNYTVYKNEKPKTTNLKELIPFAFLEAIKVHNFSLARSYLTDELNKQLEDEHLLAYFGEFVDIVPVDYYENSDNKIAIIHQDKKRQAKLFEVCFEKNKISNFTQV